MAYFFIKQLALDCSLGNLVYGHKTRLVWHLHSRPATGAVRNAIFSGSVTGLKPHAAESLQIERRAVC